MTIAILIFLAGLAVGAIGVKLMPITPIEDLTKIAAMLKDSQSASIAALDRIVGVVDKVRQSLTGYNTALVQQNQNLKVQISDLQTQLQHAGTPEAENVLRQQLAAAVQKQADLQATIDDMNAQMVTVGQTLNDVRQSIDSNTVKANGIADEQVTEADAMKV